MNYTDEYRNQVIQKLLKPGGPSVREMGEDIGIHYSTLYKWIREQKNGHMKKSDKPPRKWPLIQKMAALLEASGKTDDELGHWLREKGLHSEHLERFEEEIKTALSRNETPDLKLKKENKALRKDLDRKDKALAEVSALLVLKKKFQTLLEGREDSLT